MAASTKDRRLARSFKDRFEVTGLFIIFLYCQGNNCVLQEHFCETLTTIQTVYLDGGNDERRAPASTC